MPEIKFNSDDVLTVTAAAKILKVSRRTIYNWIDEDKIQRVIFGGNTYIPKSEVERLKPEEVNSAV